MNVPNKNIVGKKVKLSRFKLSLTQDQLSAKLARQNIQIDRAGISKIENGMRGVYDYELKALAKVLSICPTDLLGE